MLSWKYINNTFYLGDKIITPTSIRNLEEIRPVLKNPKSEGPKVCYLVYRDVEDPDKPIGLSADVTVLLPGKIGDEYSKTHGHYHIGEGVEIYKVLSGEGMIIMQRPSFNFDTVEAVRLVKLPVNQQIEIPSGWGHTLINLGGTPLVAVNYQDPGIENLYAEFVKKKGAAYYITEKSGKLELEPNPSYGEVPRPQTF